MYRLFNCPQLSLAYMEVVTGRTGIVLVHGKTTVAYYTPPEFVMVCATHVLSRRFLYQTILPDLQAGHLCPFILWVSPNWAPIDSFCDKVKWMGCFQSLRMISKGKPNLQLKPQISF